MTSPRDPGREYVGGGAFTAVVVLSLVMLFAPSSGVPSGFQFSDKIVHFLLFASLAVTGRFAALPPRGLAAGLVAYAALSEVLQAVLPIGRHGDVRDVLADVLGVGTGLLVTHLLTRRRTE